MQAVAAVVPTVLADKVVLAAVEMVVLVTHQAELLELLIQVVAVVVAEVEQEFQPQAAQALSSYGTRLRKVMV